VIFRSPRPPAATLLTAYTRFAARVAWVVVALSAVAAAGDDVSVRGSVRDAAGQPVAGARIAPRSRSGPLRVVVTDPDGSFEFDPAGAPEGRLVVSAPGYQDVERAWSAAGEPVVIVLERQRRAEEVTVTASRTTTRLADTASRVVVLDGPALQSTAAPTLDDALRQVPGFSLFRRSDSRVANPTAQGASLRGVGPSGASRSLVLLDGVPLNDPFGGWVYWSRAPRIALERVEVLEGGASDLYGSAALGGVIQAVERSASPAIAVEASAGSLGTAGLAAFGAASPGAWTLRGAAEAFTSDGYVLVPPEARGPVDTPAGGSHVNGALTLERRLSPGATVFVRGAALGESRANGTPLQVNDTDWRQVSAGGDWTVGAGGTLSARAWYGRQVYHQTFSAVSADRESETLTRVQRVPSDALGASLQWTRPLGERQALVAGLGGRWVDGRSDENAVVGGAPRPPTSAGGTDRTLALFASDRIAAGDRVVLTFGARVDRWKGGERDATAFSPRASFLLRVSRRVRLTAAGYGAFRSPTLNELHRSFRVGGTVTLANPSLTFERLGGGEVGAVWSASDRLRVRAVAFAARVADPVANVTIETTPTLITRERQNLGSTRSLGVEADVEAEPFKGVHVSGGYAFLDSTVVRFPANPALEGLRLPQVPRHQATAAVRFARRAFELGIEGRGTSGQFEDDLNQTPLAGYVTFDARAARRLGRVSVFLALENLGGTRYDVGRTPVPTEGPPRAWRAGIRFE
jgi:outer membrane receptor protein involved in Fe transport